MRIAILAAIGSQNLWDELILKNQIYFLEEKYSEFLWVSKNEIEFSVFSYDVADPFFTAPNVAYYSYFPMGVKKIANIWKNCKNFFTFLNVIWQSDRVVLWWGGILFDEELQSVSNPLLQIYLRLKYASFLRKKIEVFRVWINIKNPKNYTRLFKICDLAKSISVRDRYSYRVLEKMWFTKRISIEKDPVFYDKVFWDWDKRHMLQSSTDPFSWESYLYGSVFTQDFTIENLEKILDDDNTKISLEDLEWKKVAIALRQRDIWNYSRRVYDICKFLVEHKAVIIFVPHSFHKTDKLANDYYWLANHKNNLESDLDIKIEICTNMEESYKIYTDKKVDFVFAQRLHSIILSQIYEIPFLWISYSKKTREIIEQIRSI